MSEKRKREKIKQMFQSLKKEGSPGLSETEPRLPEEKEEKKPQPQLKDRGSYLEKNAMENLFPGVDLSEVLESEEDKKRKKLKLSQLMSQKLARRR